MRQASLIGIPIKAVVYGNSHGVLAASPAGEGGVFYIAYYSSTGGALIGYQPDTEELINVELPITSSPQMSPQFPSQDWIMKKSNEIRILLWGGRVLRVKLTESLPNLPRKSRPPTGVLSTVFLDHSAPTAPWKLLK